MSNQFTLMREKRFRPFFFVQFLGAFNDNLFKTALITLVVFQSTSLTSLNPSMLATLLPGVFILPFFLFSATSGQIADKYEKSSLMRLVKLFEIFIMMFAALGFIFHVFWLLVLALFLMGMHSTLFGPVKYAYLPQHLNARELLGGNGMVEMGTFLAILFGQIGGAWLVMQMGGENLAAVAVVLFALLGYVFSRQVPDTPAADAQLKINWNPLTETYRNIRLIRGQSVLWVAALAISWFWFFGATLLAQFPQFAKAILHGDEGLFILMLALFSVGVGAGSLFCEKLSKGLVEIGLVPIGGLGLTLFGVDLYLSSTDYSVRLLIDIGLIGFFGGIFIVPLYTLVQSVAQKTHQSRVIAANNILNALFMVLSAGFSMLVFSFGMNIPQLFLITALLNLLVLFLLCWRQPEYWRRMLQWLKP
jgi:MFS family permease